MFETLAVPRRLPKSEATIAAILRAAAKLFVERSYAEVTMNDIAKSARLTKGAVYHHFQSKEQVYVAMLRSELAIQGERFAGALASGGSCRERLRNLISYFLSLSAADRGVVRLLRRDINLFAPPVRSQLIRAYQQALPEPVQRVLEEGMGKGELKRFDARLLSWQFVALVEVMLNEYASRLFSRDDQIDYVVELLFCGVSTRPGDCPHE
jgi:AcrR family transcriptional regulator